MRKPHAVNDSDLNSNKKDQALSIIVRNKGTVDRNRHLNIKALTQH